MDTEKLKDELYQDEGFRSHAYKDHLGYLTIAIGRLIDKRRGGGVSLDEAYFLLGNDIEESEQALDEAIPWWRNLSDDQQRGLLNMSFQLGVDGLLQFQNMLGHLQDGNYEAAYESALNSKWASQTPERAERVADRLRSTS